MSNADDPGANPMLDEPTMAPGVVSELALHDDSPALPVAGTRVDEYEIVDEIARGGMGVVYRARHNELDRTVALKMVLDADSDSQELHDRFANEARAAAAIENPGIVPVYDVGTWRGNPYFTMAFVDGESLHDLLRDGPLSAKQAAEIARDVSKAIASAHELKIVHRDLKPANILIDQLGATKVTDFGVSKFLESASDLTTCGELVGTPHYMPPEQAGSNGGVICPASDVYSIGAVLYASLTGRPPFQAASPIDVVGQVITQQPVAPSALVAGVPVALDVIVLKCLAKKASDRYSDAAELSADLTRYLEGQPIKARPPGLWQRMRLLIQRHVVLASVSGTAALSLLLLTGIVTFLHLRILGEYDDQAAELESTKQQLKIERATMARFLNADSKPESKLEYVRLETDRLVATAVEREEEQPDIALQLALASADLALSADLDPQKAALDLIRRRLAALAPSTDLPDSPRELLSAGRESISKILTAQQSELYGLADAGATKQSLTPLEPKTSDDE